MRLPIPPEQAARAGPPLGRGSNPDGACASETRSSVPAAAMPPAATVSNPPFTGQRPGGPGRREAAASKTKLHIRMFRVSDSAVMLFVLVSVFIVTNIGDMPGGIGDFLGLRITMKNLLLLVAFAAAWRGLGFATGLYDWQAIRSRRSESLRVMLACALVSGAALAFPLMSMTGAFKYSAILYFGVGTTLGVLVLRNLIRMVLPLKQAGAAREALIVGAGPRGQRLYRELGATRGANYNILGFVDSADQGPFEDHRGTMLGRLEDLEGILMRTAVDEVLIVLPIKSQYAEIQRVLESCERVGVRARYMADLFETSDWVSEVENDRLSVVAAPRSPEGWRLVAKRVIDIVGASTGLVLVSPLLLVAAIAIKATSPGPVLFTQLRYGLNRRLFKMFKLRSMVTDADALQASLESRNEATGPVFKIRNDPRLTKVGTFLRQSSLDEFPQLLNVLRGEMSLVGPRPLPVRDVHRFSEAALMRRFSVRPGLTCLWQISGRSNLTFEDWIRLDLQYIDEWSMRRDMWVLLKTIPVVLKGTGAS